MAKGMGCVKGCAYGFIGFVVLVFIIRVSGSNSSVTPQSNLPVKYTFQSNIPTKASVKKEPLTLELAAKNRFKANLRDLELPSIKNDGVLFIDASMQDNFTAKMIRNVMSSQARECMSEVYSDREISKDVQLITIRFFGKTTDVRGRESDRLIAVYSLPKSIGETVVWKNIYSENQFITLLRTQGGKVGFMLDEFQFSEK